MSASYLLAPAILEESFSHFRGCGCGRRECQVLWISSWQSPNTITRVVHPSHLSRGDGFVLDDAWLDAFWRELAKTDTGIRIQVHTHPGAAFHSPTDDAYPIIHTPGFLSLVIPNFGLGPVGFDRAFLTEIQPDGSWREVPIASRLSIA